MSEDSKKPSPVSPSRPPMVADERIGKNWLGSKIEAINEGAAAEAQEARNRGLNAVLRGGEIVTDIENQRVDYERAVARNEPENINAEIEHDREKIRTDRKETKLRGEKAEAESKQIIGDFEAQAAKSARDKETAEAEQAEARVRKREAEKKLAALDAQEDQDSRQKLVAKKVNMEIEIDVMQAELTKILDQDGERIDAIRRSLNSRLKDLEQRLKSVVEEIEGMDGNV